MGMSVDIYEPILAYIYGTRGSEMEPNGVLWFLPCLFMTEIIFLFISKAMRKQNLILLILILFSINGYYCLHISFKLPWSIVAAFNGIVFYGLGYLIKDNLLSIKTRTEAILNRKVLFSILLIFVNVSFSIKNGFTSIENNMNNYLYYYVAALSGIGALILLSKSFKWAAFVFYLGQHSLILLCLHDPAKRIVLKGISVLTNIPMYPLRDSLIGGIVCCILTVFLLVPFIWIINNYFGFMLGRFDKTEA
jgi:fucose 4-O-acetylase-like acetyltransferase